MRAEIESAFAGVIGLPCWGVHWDCDTGLHLDFGEPHLDIEEPRRSEPGPGKFDSFWASRRVYVEGAWRLWIDNAYWKLSLRDMPPVTGSSSYRRILMGTARLDGQKLTSVVVNERNGRSMFCFDLGAVLDVRRASQNDEYSMWDFRMPDDSYLMVRGDGRFRIRPSGVAEDELEWMPSGRV